MTRLPVRGVMVIAMVVAASFAVVFKVIGALSGRAVAGPARRDDDGGGDRHGRY